MNFLNEKLKVLLKEIENEEKFQGGDYLKELTFRTWLIEKVDEYIDELADQFENYLYEDITTYNFEDFLYKDADWVRTDRGRYAVIGYRLYFDFPDWEKVFQKVLKELGYEEYLENKDLLYKLEREIIEDEEFYNYLYYFTEDFFIELFKEHLGNEDYMYFNLFYNKSYGPPFVGAISKEPSEFFMLDRNCLKKKLISLMEKMKKDNDLWYGFIERIIGEENYNYPVKEWIEIFNESIGRFYIFLLDNDFDYLDCVSYTEKFSNFLEDLKEAVKNFKNTIESEDFWVEEFLLNWRKEIEEEIEFYEINKNIKETNEF